MFPKVEIKRHVEGEHPGRNRYWFDFAGVPWELLTSAEGGWSRLFVDRTHEHDSNSIWPRVATFEFDDVVSVQTAARMISMSLHYFEKGQARGASAARAQMRGALGL